MLLIKNYGEGVVRHFIYNNYVMDVDKPSCEANKFIRISEIVLVLFVCLQVY